MPQQQSFSPDAALLGPRIVSRQKTLAALFARLGVVPSLPVNDCAPATAGADYRLVKGPKFPTHLPEGRPDWNQRGSEEPGAYTVLAYRAWDDTYRLRPVVEPKRQIIPTPPGGPRITDTLSHNGKRAIDDSARYLATTKRGYRTMITLTMDQAARQRTAVQVIEADYCDIASQEAVEVHGRYCPLAWNRQGELIDMPTVEGVHTLKPATTMQREASRFFDGAQKIYQRGMDYIEGRDYRLANGERWTINSVDTSGAPVRCRLPGHATGYAQGAAILCTEDDRGRLRFERAGSMGPPRIPREIRAAAMPGAPFTLITPIGEKLRYCWVAENPKNDDGQDNPHIHVNLDWQVPLGAFRDWAARLESLWGQGFAHIERLRDPAAAGAYLLKAAHYLGKGTAGEQGAIIGNRYFISKEARAPKFQGLAYLPYGQLALLLEHAHHHQRDELAPLRRSRDAARAVIKRATKDGRAKLTGKLKGWRKEIEGRDIIAGRHQLLCKGAFGLGRFLSWATDADETAADGRLLPSKPAGHAWGAEALRSTDRAWRTTPTADVLTLRASLKARRLEAQAPWTTDDDLTALREFYDRWEPIDGATMH